ncbi:MAG: sigma 54-interacting transcriptional regulator [Planctomycetaceae bacterium]|nr:sigma 54-interacting transcriptional regulator [Planctomycetales bacterium]MCB9925934.1 sigma 54-interacting transcriptional regulator [Planctomycetaceae bacterium]
MAYSLVLLNGSKPGTTLRLDPVPGVVTLGRHISNDLQLDDDKASRMHSRISLRGDRWHIEDCDSLNGTHVNSQPIEQSLLESGDLIRIGDRLILFVDSDSTQEPADVQTSVFRATTMMGRHSDCEDRGGLVEESVSESMSRIVRDSAVLCRLANLLHQHSDIEVLIRSAIDALVDGVDADSVSVWLVAADGRLRCAGRWGETEEKHLLASLAVEKGKAILINHPDSSVSDSVTDSPAPVGLALGVPIPGPQTCRGAIECHRSERQGPFSRSDLDFSVVVAHQAGLALENLEHRERLELANAELRRRLSSQNQLVGTSKAMKQVVEQIGRVGPASSTVLILGESGTGKELVARSIHDMSRYSAGPYVTVNCAAFSESLLESELFGHEVGAFTGADRRYIGQFERAHRGTLFLDEIGEMSLACQAKLLRVLEGHAFQRLGGTEEINVDVRMIAATHRDLPAMIAERQFREDLYYRLRVIDIKMPPLRDREEDVIELAAMFVESFRSQMGRGPLRLSKDAMQALRNYRWPGNVRELKNAVERAVVLGQGDEMEVGDLGLPSITASSVARPEMITLKEAEERHIKFVLERCDGNKTQACKVLGIGRATLYSKLGSD